MAVRTCLSVLGLLCILGSTFTLLASVLGTGWMHTTHRIPASNGYTLYSDGSLSPMGIGVFTDSRFYPKENSRRNGYYGRDDSRDMETTTEMPLSETAKFVEMLGAHVETYFGLFKICSHTFTYGEAVRESCVNLHLLDDARHEPGFPKNARRTDHSKLSMADLRQVLDDAEYDNIDISWYRQAGELLLVRGVLVSSLILTVMAGILVGVFFLQARRNKVRSLFALKSTAIVCIVAGVMAASGILVYYFIIVEQMADANLSSTGYYTQHGVYIPYRGHYETYTTLIVCIVGASLSVLAGILFGISSLGCLEPGQQKMTQNSSQKTSLMSAEVAPCGADVADYNLPGRSCLARLGFSRAYVTCICNCSSLPKNAGLDAGLDAKLIADA